MKDKKIFNHDNAFTTILILLVLILGIFYQNPKSHNYRGFSIILNSNLIYKNKKVNIFAENKSTNKYPMLIRTINKYNNIIAKCKLKKERKKLYYLK